MNKVNGKKRHHKILPRYTFKAEDERGDYDNGKYREGCINSCGYVCHSYKCEDGKFHTITEHIAKYEALIGEAPDGLELDHLDGNQLNNKLSNLAIKTHRDNMNNPNTYSRRIGLFKGENNPNWGKHISEETKNKISISKKGKPNLSASKSLDQIDSVTGEVVHRWNAASEASRALGLDKNAVAAASRGNYNRLGNHYYKENIWFYHGD